MDKGIGMGEGIAIILLCYLALIVIMFIFNYAMNMSSISKEQKTAKEKKQQLKYLHTKVKAEINGIEYYTRMFNMWALAGTDFKELQDTGKKLGIIIENLDVLSSRLNPDIDGKTEEEYVLIQDYIDGEIRRANKALDMAHKIAKVIAPESPTHMIQIKSNKDSKVSKTTQEVIDDMYAASRGRKKEDKEKRLREQIKLNEIRKEHAEIAIQKAQLRADAANCGDDESLTSLAKRLKSVDIEKDPDAGPLLADIIFDATRLFNKMDQKTPTNIMPDFASALKEEFMAKRKQEEEEVKKETIVTDNIEDEVEQTFLEVRQALGVVINPNELDEEINTNYLDTGDE